jgi:hypothetical protein
MRRGKVNFKSGHGFTRIFTDLSKILRKVFLFEILIRANPC